MVTHGEPQRIVVSYRGRETLGWPVSSILALWARPRVWNSMDFYDFHTKTHGSKKLDFSFFQLFSALKDEKSSFFQL